MIVVSAGNILVADVEALVNTVNTVGVMGKGLALQFRKAYPAMFDAYRVACERGEVVIGSMWVWPTEALSDPKYVVNFPTKRHWRGGSKLEYIDAGLDDLVSTVRRLGISSIAIPPLGVGNGGLNWTDVECRIRRAFEPLSDVRVNLFPPLGAPAAADMVDRRAAPRLTSQRAALVTLLHEYEKQAVEPSVIEVQKLSYFLQEAGESLNLRFTAGKYGPYADALRRTLIDMEPHYLMGFGDGSKRVMEAEPIHVQAGAYAMAQDVLAGHDRTRQRIDRVLDLVDGFESWYGMELLGSVHWIARRRSRHEAKAADVHDVIQSWTPRKASLFTLAHVERALQVLDAKGWLPDSHPTNAR